MKTKKEQNALKEKEVEAESKEPRKLTEEELAQVSGGANKYFLNYNQNAELELN